MSAYYYDVTKPLFVGSTLLSAWVSGHIATDSRSGILTKISSATDRGALKAWAEMYASGRDTNPRLAIVSALCSFGAAYSHYHAQAPYRSWMFIAAGVSTLAIAPWTWLVMLPTNNELFKELDAADASDERGAKRTQKVTDLLGTWRWMNWCRAALPLIGAFCAIEAL